MHRRLTRAIALAAIGFAAIWAIAPIDPPSLEPQGPDAFRSDPSSREEAPAATLNLAAFDARLWHEPRQIAQAALATTQRPPSAPFPDAQLIAIINTPDGPIRAAIYLPAQDEIVLAAQGDSLAGGLRVVSILPGTVEIAHQNRTKRLTLSRPPPIRLGSAG